MKHINTLITTALLVVCSVAVIGDKEWLGLATGVVFWLFSLYVYYGIYNTPSKDSERYLAWKKILPETGQINRRLWTWIAISVLALLSVFLTRSVVMTKVAFFGMRYIDIVFGALFVVMIVLKGLWQKNNDLERSKAIFGQIEQYISDYARQNPSLIDPKKIYTPDTPMDLQLTYQGRAYLLVYNILVDLLDKHTVKQNYDLALWKLFEQKNNLKSNDELSRLRVAVAIGKYMATKTSTLGGLALWVNDAHQSCERDNLNGQLGNLDV